MKKTLMILIAFLFSFIAMAQEKKEMKLELKNGSTLTGMVTVQQDGSYILENTSGDIFYFEASEVRKATVIFESPVSQTADLNDFYGGKTVYKKGGSLRFYANNEKLTQKDFANIESWEKYKKAQRISKAGTILYISAGGATVIGGVVGLIAGHEWESLAEGAAGGALFVGAPCIIGAIICDVIGNKRLKIIAQNYNQNPGYSIDFGAQQNGVGFALKF